MYLSENLEEIKSYKPARLATGKEWFVEYYAYNIELKKMVRKKIMLNHIDKVADRRTFAQQLMKRLNNELAKGWNPYVADENARSYALLTKVLDDFINLQRKKHKEGDIRDSTINSYESFYNKLLAYFVKEKLQTLYVYYFNKDFISKYLDYVYTDLNLASRTRDNHLKFIRLFCNYLVERSFLKASPAEFITVLGKSKRGEKNRTIIPDDLMDKIWNYLAEHKKGCLLATKIQYYCMIRPLEMSFIKLQHIDIEKSVIFVPGETAKNYKNAVVTMPEPLKNLIIEMGIHKLPSDYYLFSVNFDPGTKYHSPRYFDKYWQKHVRKDLKLPMTIKFYSFKDTGITNMIRKYNDPILARDQARHHDLSITNMYLPPDMMQANEIIKNDTRKF